MTEAKEYAQRIASSEEPARNRREVADAVLANPDLLAELAGDTADLRNEHPNVIEFVNDVMRELAGLEAA